MGIKHDSQHMTIEELWQRAKDSARKSGTSCDESMVNWARTLLAQGTVAASLLGIRLPRPTVTEQFSILWELPKAHISIRPETTTPSTVTDTTVVSGSDNSHFVLSGSISSPLEPSRQERKDYLTFTVRGNFKRELLFASVMNWFPLDNSFPLPPSRTVRSPAEDSIVVQTVHRGRQAIWIRPEEAGDVNEVVRWNLTRLKREGTTIHGVRMTPDQMAHLRRGWDGTNSPAPPQEAIECVRFVVDNLDQAAKSLGKEFEPASYVFVEYDDDAGANVTIVVSVDTGTTYVEMTIQAESDHNRMSFLLDYDPTDTTSRKWFLAGECTIARDTGKTSLELIKDLLRE